MTPKTLPAPTRRKPDRHRSEQVTTWFFDRIPTLFNQLLQGWGPGQLALLLGGLLLLSIPLIMTPLQIGQQAIVALILIAIGWVSIQVEKKRGNPQVSEAIHLFLVWLSLITTLRYLYYRTSYTLNFDGWINSLFSLLLYLAELYAIVTLLLSYFQTLKLKERQPVDLSQIPQEQWFNVDIYIPTYNEDVAIVRKTVLGALAIDYPANKKRVYVLDDGRAEKYRARREQLRQMCEDLGCTLLTRDNNDHAKAGNINTAMQKTQGDLILILDCDHIPSRQFLQHTVGFFYNPKVALVQTPHWFYNPDPFERNLMTRGEVPVGNELFYKILQKGNDFWNAAFFCGSAAVIRKDYVQQIGGIATETVTEDCHTSFRLHSLGYESVYYDKIMVAGLAPEKFSALVGQQVRWARGMAQILRLENPLLNPHLKLTLPQRLCYFSATSHFFFGFPRLMYAIAPVLFLVFGVNPIQGLGLETLVYALPHILLSSYTNFIAYKQVRFSFWNEIYEFALSFQAGIVTLMALINPKLGKFNVTDKGLSVTERSFDWESARGLLVITGLVLLSLLTVPFWLLLRPEDSEAVLVNSLWSGFNFVLLVSALLVALEQPQLRRTHRLNRQLTAILYGQAENWQGKTVNVSETGCQIILDSWPNLPDQIELELVGDFGSRAFLNAQIVRAVPLNEAQVLLAIEFLDLSQSQLDSLCVAIYADVQEWYAQKREKLDDPLGSFKFIAGSLSRSLQTPQPATAAKPRKQVHAFAQFYLEGHFYEALVLEISSQSLRLELEAQAIPQLELMQRTHPIVGLLLPLKDEPLPKRLLAQIESAAVNQESAAVNQESAEPKLVVELRFPEQLSIRQNRKIKHLLRTLT